MGLWIYVWKTWHIAESTQVAAESSAKSVEEMQRSREQQLEPRVVVYFSSASSTLAEIVIENFGGGAAAEVQCTFSPKLQSTLAGDVALFFTTPKWLPPSARLNHAFDTWPRYISSSLPRTYSVAVSYKDASLRRHFSNVYVLDVNAFEHLIHWNKKSVNDIAIAFETLNGIVDRSLQKLLLQVELKESIWQVTPTEIDLTVGLAQLLAMWRLFKALEDAPNAYPFSAYHFAGMKKVASSAMAAALKDSVSADLLVAIESVFVALHNHDFDVFGDREEAMGALDKAIGEVSKWLQSGLQ